MGRETKILLGLLGMLAFVFLGALVAKLFVPRPPIGLGVDVHSNLAVAEPAAIVAPPELGRPGRSAFTAASSAAADVSDPRKLDAVAAEPIDPGPDEPVAEASAVVQAAFQEPVEAPPQRPMAVDRAVRQGIRCTVIEGDSWWSLAEAAYGDGRWYRGLYAWNRAIDPSVSLILGTQLVVPTAAELSAAYPRLVPAGGPPPSGH